MLGQVSKRLEKKSLIKGILQKDFGFKDIQYFSFSTKY